MAKTTTTKKTTAAKPAAKKTVAIKTATPKTTSAKPSANKKSATPAEVLAMLKKKYDEVFDDKTVYTVKLNNKYGFVDRQGKVLIAPRFNGIDAEFTEGAITTWGEKGVGFVNDKGVEIVKPTYNSSRSFKNGLAAVAKKGKWGFVNKTGKEIIPLIYDEVDNFDGKSIKVKLNGKEMKIDAKGKPIAAKTTATKKATASKTAEISVTGNKKIDTLRKEFNKAFPYLRLGLYYSYARQQVAKGESITPIDGSKTLASVRRADSGGDISISGNKKIKTLEKEFDTVFGLYSQVCYTEGDNHRYYTSGSADEKTLASFNAECEKNGCKKGAWK